MLSLLIAILAAVLPSCADESADWCVWDASVQGNGAGTSFVSVGGTVHYLTEGK